MNHDVTWDDGGRPPISPPDPRYPEGIDIDYTHPGEKTCKIAIPYPTGHVNIGRWLIFCHECGLAAIITAASRPDDPRSIVLPCQNS